MGRKRGAKRALMQPVAKFIALKMNPLRQKLKLLLGNSAESVSYRDASGKLRAREAETWNALCYLTYKTARRDAQTLQAQRLHAGERKNAKEQQNKTRQRYEQKQQRKQQR